MSRVRHRKKKNEPYNNEEWCVDLLCLIKAIAERMEFNDVGAVDIAREHFESFSIKPLVSRTVFCNLWKCENAPPTVATSSSSHTYVCLIITRECLPKVVQPKQ